ncbi:MAG: HDIG domain-containing protein [Chloroflexi bacterium]|nr:HDIG domain-containing protein [Dehalococcoidia bacterium]MCO5202230.1 HDIG domain-containing protein [Chloroflexota bacterium]MCZ7578152.1 HDIG domain-containing protein [Dehalococcoidia bacterium]
MIRRKPVPAVSRTTAGGFGLVLAALTVLLVVPLFRFDGALREGDIAPTTFEAVRDAQFESIALTEAARQEAAAAVEEVAFPVDSGIRDEQAQRLDRYLSQVRAIIARTDLTTQQKIDQIGEIAAPSPVASAGRFALQAMDLASFEAFQQRTVAALTQLMSAPIRPEVLGTAIDEYLARPENSPATSVELTAMKEILRAFVVANFQVDVTATEAKRADAVAAVQPVVRTIAKGQVIVIEGQPIAAQDIEALRATGVIDDGIDVYGVAGGAIIAVGFGLLLGAYAYLFQPFEAPARRRMAVVTFGIVAVLLGTRIMLPILTPDTDNNFYAFALPVAAAAMIAASFADLSFAALVALVVGLFAAFVGGTAPQIAGTSYVGSLQSLELGMAYAAGGLAGAAVLHRADRLSRYAFSAVAVALATGAVMLVFWLVGAQRANIDLAWIGLAATLHGAGAALLAVGVFIMLSVVFGVTTRLQLLELAQSDHPLLRRLQDEAPGTYHHSMLVGALAERAAAQIGADALVVRVGAYYHDIGKLMMPGYYVENMLDGSPSPHDELPPNESAAIIRAHVTNGIDLAKRYRLPAVIRDFIPQHHGTRLVTFFYRRASQKGGAPEPADYRYVGPRPQTKEAAIVMLADSCEAIVRARNDDGAPTIDQLIDGVLAERLAEGQLDECDITMREMQAVAASFKSTLRAVYHPRVQYPEPTTDEIAALARGETPVSTSRP